MKLDFCPGLMFTLVGSVGIKILEIWPSGHTVDDEKNFGGGGSPAPTAFSKSERKRDYIWRKM